MKLIYRNHIEKIKFQKLEEEISIIRNLLNVKKEKENQYMEGEWQNKR